MDIATIQIGNLIIGEPMTSVTDIGIAITSFVLVARVRDRLNESGFYAAWRMFFLFMGISTSIGTIAHAINGSHAVTLFNTLWMCMITSSSIAVFFANEATIRFMHTGTTARRYMQTSNLAALLVFVGLTFLRNNFEIFKYHAAAGVLFIFFTHLIAWMRSHWGSGWLVAGMGLSICTVFIHSVQFSFGIWFNYKDISHVIMVLSLLFIYNGIRVMNDQLVLSNYKARVSSE